MSASNSWDACFPPEMREFCRRFIALIADDERYLAVLASGSAVGGRIDRFSDLDLKVIVTDKSYERIFASREKMAGKLGDLGFAYTHLIGKRDRCLFCLYSEPFLRVDFHFATIDALDRRVERLVLIFDRDGAAAARLAAGRENRIEIDADEFDNQFWIWAHQTARRLGRGELFETIDMLSIIRARLLGRMAQRSVGRQPFASGMRRIELHAPHLVESLRDTVPDYSPRSAADALLMSVELYRLLRKDDPPERGNEAFERQVLGYVETICAEVSGRS